MLRERAPGAVGQPMVMEEEVSVSEIEGRCHAELQVLMEPEFGQYAYAQPRIPSVLVCGDERLGLTPVFVDDGLRADIVELQVLHMGAYEDAEVHGPEISIRPILHPALLGSKR